MRIVCPRCGIEYPLDSREWVCPRCSGILELTGVPAFDPALVVRGDASLWRYRQFLPLPQKAEPVTMGEGFTPLVPVEIFGKDIHAKLDFLMPSGSFKDRGTTVMVSALRALGIDDLVEDSSGNAAASLSAYCARAGLRATIFAPAHASPVKLAQISVYGTTLRQIQGAREKSARAAQDTVINRGAYYASHYYNPFALFGMQTTAWEIWEQLANLAPDNVIMPVGHGTNMVGMYRGFCALRERGWIKNLPRFFAAQAENIAPLAGAFSQGHLEPSRVEPYNTVAEGIAITLPVHGAELLHILRETGGKVLTVNEVEIQAARTALAHRGIYIEPTSATAVAALEKIPDLQGSIVVPLTGSGLKSP